MARTPSQSGGRRCVLRRPLPAGGSFSLPLRDDFKECTPFSDAQKDLLKRTQSLHVPPPPTNSS